MGIMKLHFNIRVKGLVQGVWFRKYTQEAAIGYHLVGIVKNEADGSVYIEAEGKETELHLFIKWLHKGSPLSKVKEVKWEEGLVKAYAEFKISR